MAGGGPGPPEKFGKKPYKCHPRQSLNVVICILCENVYHTEHFQKLEGTTKVLSEVLVICDEHEDVNITSEIVNSENVLTKEARLIIAQIKTAKKEEIKKQIIKEFHENTTENSNLNATIYDEHAEFETLKIENTLLKELNAELQDKNLLLKQLLKKEKADVDQTSNKKSYSEITSSYKQQPKRIPKIIIKKVKKEEKIEQLQTYVAHYLIKDKSIQTKNIVVKNDSEIIVNCVNDDSVKKAIGIMENKLNHICTIEEEQLLKPKIKIVGINNFEKMDNEALTYDINMRNFRNFKDNCKILHSYTNNKTNTQSLILEVSADIHKFIQENNNRVYVGYQNCKVYDFISVNPCYNCGGFGHNSRKCRNVTTCLKCSEKHETTKCNNTSEPLCPNCSYSNNKYHTNLEVKHVAFDSEKCAIFQTKIKKLIDMTDYVIKPKVQKYADRVGGYSYRPVVTRHSRPNEQQNSVSSVTSKITDSP